MRAREEDRQIEIVGDEKEREREREREEQREEHREIDRSKDRDDNTKMMSL